MIAFYKTQGTTVLRTRRVLRPVLVLLTGVLVTLGVVVPASAARAVPIDDLTLGFSTEGRPITAVRIGNGPRKLVLVGATHGGPEANTYRLVVDLVAYFRANPEEVPSSVRLYLIPTLNPDGMARDWRFNARGVDLNRNMNTNLDACQENDWSRTVYGARGIVSDTGGTAPETEMESRLIRDFLLDASAAIFYHSAGGELFPAFCDHPPSIRFAQAYAAAAGYQYVRYYPRYHITGGMHDWASSMGIASFTPELWNGDDSDTSANLAAVQAVLADAEALLPLPEAPSEGGVSVPTPIWRFWRSRGGADLFGMPLGPVHWRQGKQVQYFERAVVVMDPVAADTTDFVQLARLDQFAPLAALRARADASAEAQAQLQTFWEQRGGESLLGERLSGASIDRRTGRIFQVFARVEVEYDLAEPAAQARLAPVGWRLWHIQQLAAPTLSNQIR
jgi:predicted deacylase